MLGIKSQAISSKLIVKKLFWDNQLLSNICLYRSYLKTVLDMTGGAFTQKINGKQKDFVNNISCFLDGGKYLHLYVEV